MSSVMRVGLACLVLFSTESMAQNWQPLFNGVSLDGWTTQDGLAVTSDGWEVEPGGILHLDTSVGRVGNILTDREYGDFELVFEWKISAGGNNGIKYRVNDFDGRILGCEYQVIDDQVIDQQGNDLQPIHKTASLYDIYEPVEHDLLNPPGEWNRGGIVVTGNTIEHWLNGHLVMSATVGSPEWDERVGKSKFNDVAEFGRTPYGKIMITEHNDEVWYRNVFIREPHRPPTLASANDCSLEPARCRPLRKSCAQPRRRILKFFRR